MHGVLIDNAHLSLNNATLPGEIHNLCCQGNVVAHGPCPQCLAGASLQESDKSTTSAFADLAMQAVTASLPVESETVSMQRLWKSDFAVSQLL